MLLTTLLGIVALVGLISWARLPAFLAFLLVSLGLGIALGSPPAAILASVQTGIGSTLGSILSVIALGAMLGKLVAQSGAAHQIARQLIRLVGQRYVRWAFMVTGFVVGLPLFYSVGFMLLAPLVITVADRHRLPAVYIGLPMLAALSVTQGYLPPHPAPLAILTQFHADMGRTLFYGILISIPAILVSGAWFGSTVKHYTTRPNRAFIAPDLTADQMPSARTSFLTVLLPIFLIGLGAVLRAYVPEQTRVGGLIRLVGDPTVSLLIAVLTAMVTLGVRRGKSLGDVAGLLGESVREVAMLLLIFGGAGALKQVLTDGGVSEAVARLMQDSALHPYVLAWGMAAVIRVCVGSSTVSGITTAGFVAHVLKTTGVDPNLMVLSIGAGSMMFSHVNDTGFWLFREYFQLSMTDTLKTWSVMETLVSVSGLAGVMALHYLLS